jgi:hypothetical protein
MSFQKNKYTVLKGVISPELAKFVTEYFLLKRKVARTLFDEKIHITIYNRVWCME